MSKETFYFSHDYNARSDTKIKKLIAKHGYAGYGLYWAIVEDLYQNANALQTDYECIAFDLRTNPEIVKSIIEDYDLFQIEDKQFGSLSIQRRIEERDAKSQKARESAFYRWNKDKSNANAMRTQCDSNAIKESKGEEKKENNISPLPSFSEKPKKERESTWKDDFNIYLHEATEGLANLKNDTEWMQKQEQFNPTILLVETLDKSFYNYWGTEAGWKNKKKAKTIDINWKSTYASAISNPVNKVYKPKDNSQPLTFYKNSKGLLLHETEWIENGKRYYGKRGGKCYEVPMDLEPRPSTQFSLGFNNEQQRKMWVI